MENKLIVKIEKVVQKEYGTIGEETPIKDKNGVQLKVGDLVLIKIGSYFFCLPIEKCDGKYFAYGLERRFNDDGSYSNCLQIEKVKGYEEIELGFIMPIPSVHFPVLAVQYGEKDV